MKRFSALFLTVFAGVFVGLFASMAAGVPLLSGTLSLTATKYSPYPVEPGVYFDAWFLVQSSGFSASDIECELLPKYPFSLDAGENAARAIPFLDNAQSSLLKYTIRVDEKAIAGVNTLSFKCKTPTTPWVATELNVTVSAGSALVGVSSVAVSPTQIPPGGVVIVDVSVSNYANSFVKDLVLKLDLSNSPFVPTSSGSQKTIGFLAVNASPVVSFNLISSPDAALGVYKIPVYLSYRDALGAAYNKSDLIGLVVGVKPSLTASIDSSTVLKQSSKGVVVVNVANNGLSDVKLLTIALKPTTDYVLISSPSAYVGELSSDDYETSEFTLFVNSTGNVVPLPVVLSYRDANNAEYVEEKILLLRLYSQQELFDLSIEQPQEISVWVIIVAVIAVLYLALRVFRHVTRKRGE